MNGGTTCCTIKAYNPFLIINKKVQCMHTLLQVTHSI